MFVIDDGFEPHDSIVVCGASTVLFKTAERGGLPMVERHLHDILVLSVALGQDAAVWYGEKDFRFKTGTPYDARIAAWVEGSTLTMALWEIGGPGM